MTTSLSSGIAIYVYQQIVTILFKNWLSGSFRLTSKQQSQNQRVLCLKTNSDHATCNFEDRTIGNCDRKSLDCVRKIVSPAIVKLLQCDDDSIFEFVRVWDAYTGELLNIFLHPEHIDGGISFTKII